MSKVKKLQIPLTDADVQSLKAGDEVSLSGVIYTARDMAHKRLCDAIDSGQILPFDPAGAVIYYVGPSPAKPGAVVGAAGPTTSSRMDPFSPKLMAVGVKGTIGKGYRGTDVIDAMKKNVAVHFSTIGGAGALLSKHIVSSELIAYEDLGTEAIRKLEVVDFPTVVAYDSHGNTVYK